MKRKTELYDPACPDSDDDSEEEQTEALNTGEHKESAKVEKAKDEKQIEPAAKIQKVPIKLSIPITIGKHSDTNKSSSDNAEKQQKSSDTISHKNGSTISTSKSTTITSVRLDFLMLFKTRFLMFDKTDYEK